MLYVHLDLMKPTPVNPSSRCSVVASRKRVSYVGSLGTFAFARRRALYGSSTDGDCVIEPAGAACRPSDYAMGCR